MKYILYRLVKTIGNPIFKLLYRPVVIGSEYIPSDGPYILAGNHTNNLDACFMISIPKNIVHTLAKKELFDSFAGNLFFRSMGCIPVNRSIHDKNAKSEAMEVLDNNGIVGIFPEGTTNKTKDILLPFKYGAVSFASKTSCPIVPFAITGKYKLFKKNITICYSRPYTVSDNLEYENKKLMKIIEEMIVRNNEKNK